jgi:hypothetical protein
MLAVLGCGSPAMVEVKGKVYHGDQPLKATGLEQANIQFYQQSGDGEGKIYHSTFDADGNYTLKAPAGSYKVVVVATKAPEKKDAKADINYGIPVPVIPKKYTSASTTDKSLEVKADAPAGAYDIKLDKGP